MHLKLLYFKILHKIDVLIGRNVNIPEYSFKRVEIDRLRKSYGLNIFIETGTFLGETVEFFKDKFKEVYSVELSDKLATKAREKFRKDPRVRILQGDSGRLMSLILSEINEPALIWLDGHYSSEFFVGQEWVETAKGDKNTPVMEELSVILNDNRTHVIMIDDARLFNGLGDYPRISAIRKMIKAFGAKYDVMVKNDIIHILPSL